MQLKSITIENFRSFLGKHTQLFPKNAVVFVQGQNTDTGIESATGKSSLLLAISYALGIAPFSQKDFQNWNTEESMQVSLVVDFNGEEHTIFRGKNAKIVTPTKTITGAKEIEAFLIQKTGLSAAQLSFVLYKNQGANSYFLDKTNTEKRDFLSTILGLEQFEEEITKDNITVSDFNNKAIQIKATRDVFVNQKLSLEKELASLPSLVEPIQP